MEWQDEAIVLGARAHGEGHAIAELFTPAHGRWAGLVYGGSGRNKRPLLQPGNGVLARWRARTSDQLGHFDLELTDPRAASLLDDRYALGGLAAVASIVSAAMPEREPHPRLYQAFSILLAAFEDADLWPPLIARFELGLLAEAGFGLALDKCVATGGENALIYVSPKSGGAVSAEAGAPYKDKLLPLPAFLRDSAAAPEEGEIGAALRLTGYFIESRILHPANRELPEARRRLEDRFLREGGEES